MNATQLHRVAVFGWGIVAPGCCSVDVFESRLRGGDSWLVPFNGFGPDNFLVGVPDFRLEDYEPWIDERFPPRRYSQIESKLGTPTHYAIGAFIQALAQNPGIEEALAGLGTRAHVYIGSGLGDLETTRKATLALDRAQREWDAFWAHPENNSLLERYRQDAEAVESIVGTPPSQSEADGALWDHFWAAHSPELRSYLDELAAIENVAVEGEVEAGKKAAIRRKREGLRALHQRFKAPEPPWSAVPAELLWNIHNGPASQVSMLGRIHGLTFAPVAACSTFGVSLKLAVDTIRRGEADLVVVGATDPTPNPLLVGGFYQARVIAANAAVSHPLTGLRGTHIAGGAAVWIVGDLEYGLRHGFEPLGLEPLAVGVSADADHVITPSEEGPRLSILGALEEAGVAANEVGTWDLHATATPGDLAEVQTLRTVLDSDVWVTARKGTFGHGMSVGGGWELTAQYLGLASGNILPTPLREEEIHPEIKKLHRQFVGQKARRSQKKIAGKLSMGVGGINACVLSRPFETSQD